MPEAATEHDPAGIETGAWEDILRPGLRVVFVGYNPSLPAWRTGHYYANPTNRFYRLLYESGLTPRLFTPAEDRTLPAYGIGATDLIARPSSTISDVPPEQFAAGVAALRKKLDDHAPLAVCCNGIGVFRHIFGRPPVRLGRQPGVRLGTSAVFVVPSTSGLVNGRAAERLAAFRELSEWLHESTDAPLRETNRRS